MIWHWPFLKMSCPLLPPHYLYVSLRSPTTQTNVSLANWLAAIWKINPPGLWPPILASGTKFQLFLNKIWISLWSSALPLCGTHWLFAMHSPDWRNFFPALLSLPLCHCLSNSQQNQIPYLSSVFSNRHRISSYNLLLRRQRPRLKHNQWLRLTKTWSMFFSRRFSPWLN